MPGGWKTMTDDADSCWNRCHETETCVYWSFNPGDKFCILKDRRAVKTFRKGWVSGPFDRCAVEAPAADPNASLSLAMTTMTTTMPQASLQQDAQKGAESVFFKKALDFNEGDTVSLGQASFLITDVLHINDKGVVTVAITLDRPLKTHCEAGTVGRIVKKAALPETVLRRPVSAESQELHLKDGGEFEKGDAVMLGDKELGGKELFLIKKSTVLAFTPQAITDTAITLDRPVGRDFKAGTPIVRTRRIAKEIFGRTTLNQDVPVGSTELHLAGGDGFEEGDAIEVGFKPFIIRSVSKSSAGPGGPSQVTITLDYPVTYHFPSGTAVTITKKVSNSATVLEHPVAAGATKLHLADGKGFTAGGMIMLGTSPYSIKSIQSLGKEAIVTIDHPTVESLQPGTVIKASKQGSRTIYASTILDKDTSPGSMELHVARGEGFHEGDTVVIGDHVFFIKQINWPGVGPRAVLIVDHALNFHSEAGTVIRVTRQAQNHPMGDCLTHDVKFSGGVLADVSSQAANAFECQLHCLHSPDCAYFTYSLHGNYCILHTAEAVSIGKAKGYVSGPPKCVADGNVAYCWTPRYECIQGPWKYEGQTYEGCAYGRTPSGWCSLVPVQPGPWLPCIDECSETSAGSADQDSSGSSEGSSSLPTSISVVFFLSLVVIAIAGLYYLGYLPIGKTTRKTRGMAGQQRFEASISESGMVMIQPRSSYMPMVAE